MIANRYRFSNSPNKVLSKLVELEIIPLVAEELSTLYTPFVKVFAES